MSHIKQLAVDIAESTDFDVDIDQDVVLEYIPRLQEQPYIPSRSELFEDIDNDV